MGSATDNILHASQVRKTYSSGSDEELTVLNGIDLELRAGDSIAILGPSGSGKSTLLNLIGTLDKPDSGEIRIDGQDPAGLVEDALSDLRNEKIGFIFQLHYLLPQCTLLENVLVPTLAGSKKNRREEPVARAQRLLNRVGLGDRLNHRPARLSGGERQRGAVVRALINEPIILLADEPTGALDQVTAEQLGDLLVELNAEENLTLITVTHSAALAARMQRTFQLRNGKLIQSD